MIEQWGRGTGRSDEEIGELQAIAQRITRHESRFRTDGLLSSDGFVASMVAYDYGCAVNMARWGFLAGYCNRPHAERYVFSVSPRVRQKYISWADFSAGYILGQVIRFDRDSYGTYYQRVLDGHRILTSHPLSPWLHMRF